MSAYFDSGFCVRKPSWHGLEELHDRYPANWDEARTWAGLMWEPETEPLCSRRLTDEEINNGINRILADAPPSERAARLSALYQDSDGAGRRPPADLPQSDDYAVTLGTVTDSYVPITHAEFGEIMDAVTEQEPTSVRNRRVRLRRQARCGRWPYLDEPDHHPGR